jgi:hypothetical protein
MRSSKEEEMSGNIEGLRVGGDEPKVLQLSDGSVLELDSENGHGVGSWTLVGDEGLPGTLSVAEAAALAGEEFEPYVHVRTRAEVEWLRVVAESYARRADQLSRELDAAR